MADISSDDMENCVIVLGLVEFFILDCKYLELYIGHMISVFAISQSHSSFVFLLFGMCSRMLLLGPILELCI